jgi:outer membrane receptor protein involved in Fe transport
MMTKAFGHLVVLLVLCAAVLSAQSDRGSIRGTVHDASGGVIPAVKVTASNVATGVQTTVTSTDSGNYNIPQLPPGQYIVMAEKSGFKKLIRENVSVEVSGVAGLDLSLDIGAVTDSVTVQAEAPALKSETTDVSTFVSSKAFNDLPINAGGGRAPENMLYLTPGFTGNTFDAHINGSQTLSKEIQIDGMSTVIAEVQGDPRTLTFPPDAVQEMSVLTSNYPAEYGTSGGGVERMVIKSGTNALHGSAWEFLRNEKLDARGFFNSNRSVHHENEYGFVAGGPAYIPKVYDGRNKTFWFTSFNWYKNRGGAQNSIASVPDDAMRGGDLSGLKNPDGSLLQIYDPNTTTTDANGNLTRLPFAGNIIPDDRISAVSKAVLSYVPHAKINQPFNNYAASGNSKADNRNFTFKADHYITATHRLSATYNDGRNLDNGPFAQLPHPVASTRNGTNTQKTARATYDWSITPAILNQFKAGFNRQHQLLIGEEIATNYGQKVGISGINNGFPVVDSWTFTPLAQNQDEIQPISNTFLVADSLSWTRGKHNLKFGFDFRKLQHQGIYPSRPAHFNFGTGLTAFPSGDLRTNTGAAYASFLLGGVDSSSMYINDVVQGARWTYLAFYVQDDFKLTPRLTLNLGLRWDSYTPVREVYDRQSVMDPTAPNPAAGGILGAYVFAGEGSAPRTGTSRLTTAQDTYKKAFGPRLGLAYKLSERFVIRTAYGISYAPGGALAGGNNFGALDGYSGQASFQTKDNGLTPAFNWNGGFPQNFDHPPFINAGLNVGGGANMWGDKAVIPAQRQDWNFGTQYQLKAGMLLDVSYVGAKTTRLNTGAFNVNQTPTQYLSLGSDLLNKSIYDPAVAAKGFTAPYAGFNGSLAQALRPFPQYLGIGMLQTANIGNATYNSLQVKMEKQFSKGLFLLTTYTFSKSITDANSSLGGFFSPSSRDQYNRSLEKALAVYNSPHRFVTAFNYELPIGPGKALLNVKGPVGKVLQGWQVNGILTYNSGTPIQIGVNNSLPLFNGGNTPDSTGQDPRTGVSGGSFDPAKDKYLNINAFAVPGNGQIGTSGQVLPNTRNFFNMNEDFGILKRTYITETMNVELRFEMFNAFNRVIFGGPDSNISSPNFGTVSGQGNGPRNGQVALKFNF